MRTCGKGSRKLQKATVQAYFSNAGGNGVRILRSNFSAGNKRKCPTWSLSTRRSSSLMLPTDPMLNGRQATQIFLHALCKALNASVIQFGELLTMIAFDGIARRSSGLRFLN